MVRPDEQTPKFAFFASHDRLFFRGTRINSHKAPALCLRHRVYVAPGIPRRVSLRCEAFGYELLEHGILLVSLITRVYARRRSPSLGRRVTRRFAGATKSAKARGEDVVFTGGIETTSQRDNCLTDGPWEGMGTRLMDFFRLLLFWRPLGSRRGMGVSFLPGHGNSFRSRHTWLKLNVSVGRTGGFEFRGERASGNGWNSSCLKRFRALVADNRTTRGDVTRFLTKHAPVYSSRVLKYCWILSERAFSLSPELYRSENLLNARLART